MRDNILVLRTSNWKPKFNKQQKKTDNKHTKYSEFGQFFGAVGPLVYRKFQGRALSIWAFFWDRHYKMIVPSTGRHYHWYISLINEASRANVLDFRTSNFQEAAIKPIFLSVCNLKIKIKKNKKQKKSYQTDSSKTKHANFKSNETKLFF